MQADTCVLDIGCGHGDFLAPVYSKTPHTYGVDPDAQALAKNTIVRNTVVGSADALPFPDNSFDLVVSAWVLEHLDRPEQAFREMYRVLKPGGRVIFLTPNAWNYKVWLIRLIPNCCHNFFTRRLSNRQEHDTYPVCSVVNRTKNSIEEVINCPQRLYADGYECLRRVVWDAMQAQPPRLMAGEYSRLKKAKLIVVKAVLLFWIV